MGAQLSRLDVSPIAAMISKVQHHRIPDTRGSRSVQDPGPHHHRVSLGPSDLEGRVAPD
jgi:hypothetical protein